MTRHGHKVSTLDLGGKGAFTIYTGIGGDHWAEAAVAVGAELGIDIGVVVIGTGQTYEDPYGSWAAEREITDTGALLVRPDLYVAFRAATAPSTATEATSMLREALAGILDRASA